MFVKKAIFMFLVFVLFGSAVLIPPPASANSEIIPVDTVIQVIESDIKSLTPEHEFYGLWDHVQVVHRADLYDIHDNIMGYYFHLLDDGLSVGYYISGARYDITPILEYSSAPAKESLESPEAGKKFYYFGGENQATAANANELIAQIELGVNTFNEKVQQQKNISDDSTLTLSNVLKDLNLNGDPNSPQLWQENLASDAVSLMAYPAAYYLAVPSMNQYQTGVNHPKSACGPTSLSMAVQYLHSLGLPVHDMQTYFNNSQSEMINGMYNFLGTGIFGTSAGNMSYLTPQLLNMHMSGWTATNINADDSGAMDKFQDRIVSSRPPLVMWDTLGIFPWLDPSVTWHWQTGNGYRTSNGVFQLGVKDPSSDYTNSKYYNWVANKNFFQFTSYRQ
ncbi:hypothetical protein [Paenibacillus sp. IHBB 10380]|uniref:hypothetical protein n=1 Tax=Paenibacillus sp. IHBB 10380 TaxID=1566358 RepID=UPI0005CFC790|nr:hypothetical protein [Paenibacillus sp. IHBB 10380]AJS58968.1 hypothetical protein UB51_11345 [Paenibacillus sp. IHBB 10380]